MKNNLRFLIKYKQNFIALLVLIILLFNACPEPMNNTRIVNPTGNNPINNNIGDYKPISFYIDSDGNYSETDSGRIVLIVDENLEVVFYSDDIASNEQQVGFAFEDKKIIFFFEENLNFPTKMILSDSSESINGFFTLYDPISQNYSLVVEQDGNQEIWSDIYISNDIFTQYIDDPELTQSQNLRLRNLYIASYIYTSIDEYIDSDVTLNTRSFWKNLKNSVKNIFMPVITTAVGVVTIVAGVAAFTIPVVGPAVGTLKIIAGVLTTTRGIIETIDGVNEYLYSGPTVNAPSIPFIAVTGVSLNKTSINLFVGDGETLTPKVAPDNATNKNVTWKSSNTAVATIASNGTVIGLGEGTAIITVTTSNGSKTATCTVTVSPVLVTGVSLNKSETNIFIGSSETLIHTIAPVNATNRNVIWSSSNTTVATVSNTGLVTGVNVGSAVITATTVDGGMAASCTVTINPIRVTGITIKSNTGLLINGTETLTAVILPVNATDKTVSWNSSDNSVATVSNTGEVIGVGAGTATVTATTTDGGITASCTVSVSAVVISVTGVYLDKTSVEIDVGDTITLIPTITPANATNQNVTWSSSDDSVAAVSNNGEVTGVNFGKATITVTTDDGGKTASCVVTMIGTPGLAYTLINNNTAYSVSKGTVTSGPVVIPAVYNGKPVTTIGAETFWGCAGLTSITIPNSVTSIGNYEFGNCTDLTSITIPNSVTSIGEYAFYGCSSLTSITFAAGSQLQSIGEYTFYGCSGLTDALTIPSSVTSIGYMAFSGCKNLTGVTFAAGSQLQSIGGSAFSGCSGLTGVTIPASVTSIGDNAFYYCSSLTSVTIPNSVTSIGDRAFSNCSSLASITIDANNPNYSSQSGILYNKNKTSILAWPAASGSITIPNSVTSIGDNAFYYCISLESVTIPNSVTSIGNWAFSGCTSLASVLFQGIINADNFISTNSFPGDLRVKYLAGGIGTYTRAAGSNTWTKL